MKLVLNQEIRFEKLDLENWIQEIGFRKLDSEIRLLKEKGSFPMVWSDINLSE
jgi:hypothetical protein